MVPYLQSPNYRLPSALARRKVKRLVGWANVFIGYSYLGRRLFASMDQGQKLGVPIDLLAHPASVGPATWSALAENECKNFDIPLPLSDENR